MMTASKHKLAALDEENEKEEVAYLYHVNSVDLTKRHLRAALAGGREFDYDAESAEEDDGCSGSVRFSGAPTEVIRVELPFEKVPPSQKEDRGAGDPRASEAVAGPVQAEKVAPVLVGEKRPIVEVVRGEAAERAGSPKKPRI